MKFYKNNKKLPEKIKCKHIHNKCTHTYVYILKQTYMYMSMYEFDYKYFYFTSTIVVCKLFNNNTNFLGKKYTRIQKNNKIK